MWAGDDELLARKWRTTLILLGLVTAEFRAAGDAKMLLAPLFVITGFASMACRRVKHLVIAGMLVTAVVKAKRRRRRLAG